MLKISMPHWVVVFLFLLGGQNISPTLAFIPVETVR